MKVPALRGLSRLRAATAINPVPRNTSVLGSGVAVTAVKVVVPVAKAGAVKLRGPRGPLFVAKSAFGSGALEPPVPETGPSGPRRS